MTISQELNKNFPNLNDEKLVGEIDKIGKIISLPQGEIILSENQYIEYIPLVLDGLVKVRRKSRTGQEIFLYYLQKGESCAMTLSSCMRREKSKIAATVTEDVRILLIPSSKAFFFMKNHPSWSEFVFETFWNKLDSSIATIERLAFMNLEDQIKDILLGISKATHTNRLAITHESIANDLSTSRVIVSRLLKKMEKEGFVHLGHKSITIIQL